MRGHTLETASDPMNSRLTSLRATSIRTDARPIRGAREPRTTNRSGELVGCRLAVAKESIQTQIDRGRDVLKRCEKSDADFDEAERPT
jgi:hypothetical protein